MAKVLINEIYRSSFTNYGSKVTECQTNENVDDDWIPCVLQLQAILSPVCCSHNVDEPDLSLVACFPQASPKAPEYGSTESGCDP